MRILMFFMLGLLPACAAPSVSVMGGAKVKLDVEQHSFIVRHKGERAEAYRTNMVVKPKAREIFAAGATAIERATGCHVVRSSVRGDVAMIQADILC